MKTQSLSLMSKNNTYDHLRHLICGNKNLLNRLYQVNHFKEIW